MHTRFGDGRSNVASSHINQQLLHHDNSAFCPCAQDLRSVAIEMHNGFVKTMVSNLYRENTIKADPCKPKKGRKGDEANQTHTLGRKMRIAGRLLPCTKVITDTVGREITCRTSIGSLSHLIIKQCCVVYKAYDYNQVSRPNRVDSQHAWVFVHYRPMSDSKVHSTISFFALQRCPQQRSC